MAAGGHERGEAEGKGRAAAARTSCLHGAHLASSYRAVTGPGGAVTGSHRNRRPGRPAMPLFPDALSAAIVRGGGPELACEQVMRSRRRRADVRGAISTYSRRHIDLQRIASALCPAV